MTKKDEIKVELIDSPVTVTMDGEPVGTAISTNEKDGTIRADIDITKPGVMEKIKEMMSRGKAFFTDDAPLPEDVPGGNAEDKPSDPPPKPPRNKPREPTNAYTQEFKDANAFLDGFFSRFMPTNSFKKRGIFSPHDREAMKAAIADMIKRVKKDIRRNGVTSRQMIAAQERLYIRPLERALLFVSETEGDIDGADIKLAAVIR